MNFKFLLLLCCIFLLNSERIYSQKQPKTLKDSVGIMFEDYFELMKSKKYIDSLGLAVNEKVNSSAQDNKKKVDELTSSFTAVDSKVSQLNTILTTKSKEIETLTTKEASNQKQEITNNINKIINTTDFVQAANTSLGILDAEAAISAYQTEITALSNPSNTTLGFSLSEKIKEILKTQIFGKKDQVNKSSSLKILQVVDNIITHPILESFANSVPVVSSIRSVFDLIVGVAIRGEEITVDELTKFKTDLQVYLDHYEGLMLAQRDFSKQLNSINVRKDAVRSLLLTYTKDQIISFNPEATLTDKDSSLNRIITDYYTKRLVQKKLNAIELANKKQGESSMLDPRLKFPDYALIQASFIKEEIETLSEEYLDAYRLYQKALATVLSKSAKSRIGDPERIKDEILKLNSLTTSVCAKHTDAVNIKNLNTQFRNITGSIQ